MAKPHDEAQTLLLIEDIFLRGYNNKADLLNLPEDTRHSADLRSQKNLGITINEGEVLIEQYTRSNGIARQLDPEKLIVGIIASDDITTIRPRITATDVQIYYRETGDKVTKLKMNIETAAKVLLAACEVANLPSKIILDKMAEKLSDSSSAQEHKTDALVDIQRMANDILLKTGIYESEDLNTRPLE